MTMKRKIMFLGLMTLLLTCLVATTAHAGAVSGTLFYTEFAPPGNNPIGEINYNFDGVSTVTYTGNTTIAHTNGADGIIFAPDGNLLIGGQTTGNIYEVTTGGAP